jgi:uncharacterized protein YutE (UPF0331/DUF86 family)
LIPAELSASLQRASRFRNLLVHMYWKIDYQIVYRTLQESLDDLETFAGCIVALP